MHVLHWLCSFLKLSGIRARYRKMKKLNPESEAYSFRSTGVVLCGDYAWKARARRTAIWAGRGGQLRVNKSEACDLGGSSGPVLLLSRY